MHVAGRDGGGGPAVRSHVHVGVRDDVALGSRAAGRGNPVLRRRGSWCIHDR